MNFETLEQFVDQIISLPGVVAQGVSAHMVGPKPPYVHPQYILVKGIPGDMVVYTQEPVYVEPGTKVEMKGKIIRVTSRGEPGSMITENSFVEYQMLVDSWKTV